MNKSQQSIFWKITAKTLHLWREEQKQVTAVPIFQILQWQSARPGSLRFLLLFPIKKQTAPFISDCSDKTGWTVQRRVAPPGALRVAVWSADRDATLVNRKSRKRQSGRPFKCRLYFFIPHLSSQAQFINPDNNKKNESDLRISFNSLFTVCISNEMRMRETHVDTFVFKGYSRW